MYNNIRQMRVGCQYTMATFTYLGIPYHVQMTLKDIKCTGYEDGADIYQLLYKKIDTRAMIQMTLTGRKQFIIWEGLVVPDTQLQVASFIKDGSEGHVQMIKRWRHNDPRYMNRAELSVSIPPLVKNYKPLTNDQKLFDLCEVVS